MTWTCTVFDAEQAFVQYELDEEIFMRLPPGCGDASGNVVLLNRSLYELKQARRANVLLGNTLKKQGFEQCLVDPCIFRLMGDKGVKMILAVHVDDMIVVGRGEDAKISELHCQNHYLQNPWENCAGIWDVHSIAIGQQER